MLGVNVHMLSWYPKVRSIVSAVAVCLQAERGHGMQAAAAVAQLAEQHGSESWDVLKAYLDSVLPMPASRTSLCRGSAADTPHSSANGQSNGVKATGKVSVEAVRVSQQVLWLLLS